MRPVICVLAVLCLAVVAMPSVSLAGEMPVFRGWFGRAQQQQQQETASDPCANGQCAQRRGELRRPIDVDQSLTISVPPTGSPSTPTVAPIATPPAAPANRVPQATPGAKLGVVLAIFALASAAAVTVGFKRRATAKKS